MKSLSPAVKAIKKVEVQKLSFYLKTIKDFSVRLAVLEEVLALDSRHAT